MTTIRDVLGNHTPLSNNVVQVIGLVKGAVACKIFYTSSLRDRVCRMGQTRLARELGIDKSTASKAIKWLMEMDYIEKVKEYTPTEPAQYICTQKFYDLAEGIDLINTPIDQINAPVDLINTPVDLINQEKESKEDSKKERKHPSDFLEHAVLLSEQDESEGAWIEPSAADTFFGKHRDAVINIYETVVGRTPVGAQKEALIDLALDLDRFQPDTFETFFRAYIIGGRYPYDIDRIKQEYIYFLDHGYDLPPPQWHKETLTNVKQKSDYKPAGLTESELAEIQRKS